ncbi:MAG: hypothetical protein ACKO2N_00120, partial [Tabrizicola sp.]
SPRAAAMQAMDLVAGPVIAVGLVLTAVFVPCLIVAGFACYLSRMHRLCSKFPWSRRGYGAASSLLDLAGILPGLFLFLTQFNSENQTVAQGFVAGAQGKSCLHPASHRHHKGTASEFGCTHSHSNSHFA